MWHAINNYHGLGDGFIKDVYTTHKNYDFGVLSCFMMFYYWFQMVVTWGWFIIVLLCVLLASMICGSQGYWRFHNGPQSLIFQYWTGWWFGTFFIFPYIGKINPNWPIFFRGVETTNQERLIFLASELEPQSRALCVGHTTWFGWFLLARWVQWKKSCFRHGTNLS